MDNSMRLMLWSGGLCALALAVALGPVLAGYVFAGSALVVVLALVGKDAAKAIADWRLDHPWTFGGRR